VDITLFFSDIALPLGSFFIQLNWAAIKK